jgi:hypothetical protein
VPPLAGKDELIVPYVRKVVAAARKAEHTRITVSEPIRTILADYEDAHPALVKEVKEAADRRAAESIVSRGNRSEKLRADYNMSHVNPDPDSPDLAVLN